MKKVAANAGVLDIPFGKFARLQILTIEDLLAGVKPAMPLEQIRIDRNRQRRFINPVNLLYVKELERIHGFGRTPILGPTKPDPL